jgi:hypothetical protein
MSHLAFVIIFKIGELTFSLDLFVFSQLSDKRPQTQDLKVNGCSEKQTNVS